MASPRNIVYVDTNVIIEATRTSCWKALLNRFEIHTVEEVRREALHIPKNPKAYIPIDPQLIKDQVKVVKVEECLWLDKNLPSVLKNIPTHGRTKRGDENNNNNNRGNS